MRLSWRRGTLLRRRFGTKPPPGPLHAYESLCAAGEIRNDDHQRLAMAKLERLHGQIALGWRPAPRVEEAVEEEVKAPGLSENVDAFMSRFGLAVGGGTDKPAGASGVTVSRFGSDYDYDDVDAGFLSKLGFGGGVKKAAGAATAVPTPAEQAAANGAMIAALPYAPRGLYLYGGVGCGKTLMMDTFFEHAPTQSKQRLHFHEFMIGVHRSLHALRQEGVAGDASGGGRANATQDSSAAIRTVARRIVDRGWLLCFDEFFVTDIADALVLRSLMGALFEVGAVLVATSNRAPAELYKNGIQYHLFGPCVPLLEARCEVHQIDAEVQDYRAARAAEGGTGGAYFVAAAAAAAEGEGVAAGAEEAAPAAAAAAAAATAAVRFEGAWRELTGGQVEAEVRIPVGAGGRTFDVPRAVEGARAARFAFEELCGGGTQPRGAADYMALSAAFGIVALESVPRLSIRDDANRVRRFITLVDTLYDKGVHVLVSAAAHPRDLFITPEEERAARAADGDAEKEDCDHGDIIGTSAYVLQKDQMDEAFAHERCVSRLLEMDSERWVRMAQETRRRIGAAGGSTDCAHASEQAA